MNSKSAAATLVIRALSTNDLPAVARIHGQAFPKAALTKLGTEAVCRYYEWQLVGPHRCWALGAFMENSLVGFCIAGAFSAAMTGFLKRNKKLLALRIMTHPWLIENPLIRSRLGLAGRLLFRRKPKPETEMGKGSPTFGVLSIATSTGKQHLGIGRALMQRIESLAAAELVYELNLTVHIDNMQAIGFYESLGWVKVPDATGNWSGAMKKALAGAGPNIAS